MRAFAKFLGIIAVSAFCTATTANAETTFFADSAPITVGVGGTTNLIGDTPAAATFGSAGAAALISFGQDITGNTTTLNLTSVSAAPTYVFFRFAQTTPGGGFSSAFGAGLTTPTGGNNGNAYLLLAGPGPVTLSGVAFEAACIAIGGCDSVILGVSGFSAPGTTGFAVSSVLSATPEPAHWALMMTGFGAVGWRAKAVKNKARIAIAKAATA